MSNIESILHETVVAENMTPNEALQQCDWQPQDSVEYRLSTDHGPAILRSLNTASGWQRFELDSPAIDMPAPDHVFAEHACLNMPAKFIATGQDRVSCCLDIPEEWLTDASSQFDVTADPLLLNPTLAWARSLTHFVRGTELPACQHVNPQEIVQALQQMSWSASLDDQQIHVHIQLAGVYRQAAIDLEKAGFRVRVDLVDTADLTEHSRLAIWMLADEANRRLPLVRYALDSDKAPAALQAQVFVNVALIPGGWLFAAMHAVETAVAMTALELEALRDPEFADLFIAAKSRNEPRHS